jgi:hypothetical protein
MVEMLFFTGKVWFGAVRSRFECSTHHNFIFFNLLFPEQGARLKLIGKAVSKGTQHIGKTLTILADSPDKRGQGRLVKIHTP